MVPTVSPSQSQCESAVGSFPLVRARHLRSFPALSRPALSPRRLTSADCSSWPLCLLLPSGPGQGREESGRQGESVAHHSPPRASLRLPHHRAPPQHSSSERHPVSTAPALGGSENNTLLSSRPPDLRVAAARPAAGLGVFPVALHVCNHFVNLPPASLEVAVVSWERNKGVYFV